MTNQKKHPLSAVGFAGPGAAGRALKATGIAPVEQVHRPLLAARLMPASKPADEDFAGIQISNSNEIQKTT